jgi:hypothetical protein
MIADTIVIYLDENRTELRSREGSDIRALINPGKQKREKKSANDGN